MRFWVKIGAFWGGGGGGGGGGGAVKFTLDATLSSPSPHHNLSATGVYQNRSGYRNYQQSLVPGASTR